MNPPPIPKIPFTKAAYQDLQQEFDRLTTERAAIMVRLQTAREMGDLSENGAYKYAKIELGDTNHKLRRLRHLLDNGHIIHAKDHYDKAEFGATITLQTKTKEVTYQLVSAHESNPKEGKLSLESPIGQALIGKKAGDTVNVTTPAGEMKYTVLKVA